MFRIQDFLTRGTDYQDVGFSASEETDLRRAQKEIGAQISVLQNELGLTKAQRDKDAHDSVGAAIASLKVRAKEHGVKREKELGRALELMHEMFAVIGAFERSNTAERGKLGMETPEHVLKWISEYIQVEFKAVDDYFREHQQKFWVRDQ